MYAKIDKNQIVIETFEDAETMQEDLDIADDDFILDDDGHVDISAIDSTVSSGVEWNETVVSVDGECEEGDYLSLDGYEGAAALFEVWGSAEHIDGGQFCLICECESEEDADDEAEAWALRNKRDHHDAPVYCPANCWFSESLPEHRILGGYDSEPGPAALIAVLR